jgi:hypothetical protein
VPAAVEAVVMRMLEKGPDKRYPSGRDVVAALDRALPRTRHIEQNAINIEVAPPRVRWGRVFVIALMLGGLGAIWWYALRNRGWFEQSSAGDPDAPTATAVDGLGASAWTARLLAAPAKKDWQAGHKAVSALSELDPTALKIHDVAKAAAAVAALAARDPAGSAAADEMFTLFERNFGSGGLDALYLLVDAKAGDISKRAWAQLRHSKILERATPALRITVEVRDAPCEFKHDLFERAAAEGDARTLDVLTTIAKQRCAGKKDPCCFALDKELKKAIAQLDSRP